MMSFPPSNTPSVRRPLVFSRISSGFSISPLSYIQRAEHAEGNVARPAVGLDLPAHDLANSFFGHLTPHHAGLDAFSSRWRKQALTGSLTRLSTSRPGARIRPSRCHMARVA